MVATRRNPVTQLTVVLTANASINPNRRKHLREGRL